MLYSFFDLIDNRDKKSTCTIFGSCDDIFSWDDERDGLLLDGGGYEVAGLCECEYDIFL